VVGACKRQEFCCLAETLLAFHEFVIHFCLAVIVKQYYLIQNFSHSNHSERHEVVILNRGFS
jgi:hypothetical protein